MRFLSLMCIGKFTSKAQFIYVRCYRRTLYNYWTFLRQGDLRIQIFKGITTQIIEYEAIDSLNLYAQDYRKTCLLVNFPIRILSFFLRRCLSIRRLEKSENIAKRVSV